MAAMAHQCVNGEVEWGGVESGEQFSEREDGFFWTSASKFSVTDSGNLGLRLLLAL